MRSCWIPYLRIFHWVVPVVIMRMDRSGGGAVAYAADGGTEH